MSEQTAPLGSLLSGLMEHPEMLQKAMSIASTLASSGVLNELMNSSAEGNRPTPSDDRYTPSSANTPDLSSIGNLLSGLMGDNSQSNEEKSRDDRSQRTQNTAQSKDFSSDRACSGEASARAEETARTRPLSRSEGGHEGGRGGIHVGHAERIRLLQSLRPFLPCDKQEKIDFVIKLLGLLDAAERMGLGKLF